MKSLKNGRTIRQAVGLLLVVTLGLVGLWGANLSMMTNESGNMSNCPFSLEKDGVCTMTISTHMSHWRLLLLSVPGKEATQIVLSVLMVLGVFFAIKSLPNLARLAFVFQGSPRAGPSGNFYYLYRNIGSGIVHKRE